MLKKKLHILWSWIAHFTCNVAPKLTQRSLLLKFLIMHGPTVFESWQSQRLATRRETSSFSISIDFTLDQELNYTFFANLPARDMDIQKFFPVEVKAGTGWPFFNEKTAAEGGGEYYCFFVSSYSLIKQSQGVVEFTGQATDWPSIHSWTQQLLDYWTATSEAYI